MDNMAQGSTKKYVSGTDITNLGNLSGTNTGDQDLSGLVPKTTTVNGHALSANVTVSKSDVSLGNVTNDIQLKAADLDTDGTLAANSDSKIASQKATKTYADTKYANTVALNNITAPSGDVSLNSHKITSLTDPSSDQDAATKAYVDTVAQGLSPKPSALVGTTAGLPTYTYLSGVITMTATGVVAVDGHNLALSDVVLVKNETTTNAPYNGLYIVTTAGAVGVALILTRHTSMNSSTEFSGAFVFVESGTVNTAAGFVCTNTGSTNVGVDNVSFTQFSGAGEITAGNGLSKSANTLSIDTAITSDLTTAQTFTNKTLTSPKINENVAVTSTATEINLLHGITTLSGSNTGDQTLPTDATITTTDVTTNNASTTKHGWLVKATAPSANQLNVVGIANGETVYTDKTILGTTSPSTQAFGDSASAGTSLEAGHVDHKHAMPATPTTVSGNAGTATALQTARAINGINFDGTAAITIPNLFLTFTSADSVGTGLIVGGTYGESITLGAPLYFKSDGKFYNADADGTSTYPVIGLALATASSGTNNVLLYGIYQFASAHTDFTVGGLVYLSTTVGTFTQTQPSATDNVIQACGVALAADTLFFNPSLMYITHT
jgi:hypothetical protein